MPNEEAGNVEETMGQTMFPRPHEIAPTLERQAFVDGLFSALDEQIAHYLQLVGQDADLHARLMLSERNLRLTRDHLNYLLSKTDEELPKGWQQKLHRIRFVGARLGDACIEILREKKTLSTRELLDQVNRGQFRFRTSAPLREINAALLRHPDIKRKGDTWLYIPKEVVSA